MILTSDNFNRKSVPNVSFFVSHIISKVVNYQ